MELSKETLPRKLASHPPEIIVYLPEVIPGIYAETERSLIHIILLGRVPDKHLLKRGGGLSPLGENPDEAGCGKRTEILPATPCMLCHTQLHEYEA